VDLIWPDVVIASEAIKVKAAIVRLFIVMVTLFQKVLSGDSLGQFSCGAALAVASVINKHSNGTVSQNNLVSSTMTNKVNCAVLCRSKPEVCSPRTGDRTNGVAVLEG
jgi:hypothetical protein